MWIGTQLSAIEVLTISSYLHHSHTFCLWVYDRLTTPVPPGTILRDANHILDRSYIFRYKYANQWGHGKGSVAGFSDIFRYKLLYEMGGWWTDMDVTCLRPLDHEAPYVFRNHDVLPVVGNLMKCPAGSQLMLECFEEAVREVTAENTDWFKPIRILNEGIERHGLQRYIVNDITNPDQWAVVRKYIEGRCGIPPQQYAIHWLNEEWRARGWNKNECVRGTLLGDLHELHQNPMPIVWYSRWEPRVVKRRFTEWASRWWRNGINWLKKPGIPVFVKRWWKKD